MATLDIEASQLTLDRPLPAAVARFTRLGSASGYQDEIFGILDHIWLFEDLRQEEVARLCEKMECFAAKRGDVIIQEGDEGDFLLIMLTGEVAIVKGDPATEMKRIATVGPGASIGELSLIDGAPRFASCIANEPCDFAILTRDTLYDILVLDPSLGNKLLLIILQIVSQRLRDTSEKLLPFLNGEKS